MTFVYDSVRFSVLSTERYENNEYQTWQYLDSLGDTPPYHWCSTSPGDGRSVDSLDSMMFPGDSYAEHWDDFKKGLGETLHSLMWDVPVLDDHPMTLAIGSSYDGSQKDPSELPACFLTLADGELLIESTANPKPDVVSALTELGWTPPSDEWIAWVAVLNGDVDPPADWPDTDPSGNAKFSRTFPSGPLSAKDDAQEAARLVVEALRIAGATLPELTYWVGRNGDNLGVDLPCLGVGRIPRR